MITAHANTPRGVSVGASFYHSIQKRKRMNIDVVVLRLATGIKGADYADARDISH